MASAQSGEVSLPLRFFSYFQQEITALQEQMDRLADTALIAGERADATDHCLAGISRLSSEVKDASSYLPSYDQRTYAEAIKALQEKLQETKEAFAPKPKFAFKTAKKSPSAISLSDAVDLAAQKRRGIPGYLSPNSSTPGTSQAPTPPNEPTNPGTDNERPSLTTAADQDKQAILTSSSTQSISEDMTDPARPGLSTTATSTSITNQSNAHIILPASTQHSRTPCSLSRLDSCCLDISLPTTTTTPFASLTINNVNSSLLLCGVVSGPAHMTGIKNSVVVMSCRQFRMHECHNVDVYLHCTSRPIIEGCKGIRFAELPKTYIDILESSHSNTSGKSPPSQIHEPNLYDQIDDFKWLKTEPSPNWSLLPTEEKILDDTWREVVPGGPGWGMDEILRAVGIAK